jgi:hypothetical protein
VKWYVGGGFQIDETFLTLHKFHSPHPEVTNTEDFTSYLNYISNDNLLEGFVKTMKEKKHDSSLRGSSRTEENGSVKDLQHKEQIYFVSSSVHSGKTNWKNYEDYLAKHSSPPQKETFSKEQDPLEMNTVFEEKLLLDPFLFSAKSKESHHVKHTFWVVAWAKVDSFMANSKNQGFPKNFPPQSHYVNMRTNPDWRCEQVKSTPNPNYPNETNSFTKECQGRKYWPSDFIELSYFPQNNSLTMNSVKHCAWWQYSKSIHYSEDVLFPSTVIGPPPPQVTHVDESNNNNNTRNIPSTEPRNISLSVPVPVMVSDEKSNIPVSPIPISPPYNLHDPSTLLSPSSSILSSNDIHSFLSAERIYLWIFVAVAMVLMVISKIASHRRRNQIYNALANNPYLSLPTGFQR